MAKFVKFSRQSMTNVQVNPDNVDFLSDLGGDRTRIHFSAPKGDGENTVTVLGELDEVAHKLSVVD